MDVQKMIEEKEKSIQALLGMVKLFAHSKSKEQGDISRKTEFQNTALRKVFKLTKYPTKQTREDLALFLGLSSKTVQIWFQNERKVKKKERLEKDESWEILVNINVITLKNIVFNGSCGWQV